MTTEIIIKKELQPIANEALQLKVKSHGDLLVATDLLSRLNQFNDKIAEERERITKPLNEALKVERSRWKPLEGFCLDGIEHIRSEMSSYQTAQVTKQKAKEAAVAQLLSSGDIDLDQAVAKIEKIKTPVKNIVGKDGDVQFRETQILKITDEFAIPREYLLVNEKQVLDALKEGKVVTGAEIEIKLVPINYR
jgi:hypothetical protein